METYEFIPFGGHQLLTAFHASASPTDPCGCAVIVAPIHEEKKAAHRPLVDLARRLAAEGYAVMRFDPRATGDSSGGDDQPTLTSWREDLELVIDRARGRSGLHRVDLIGLRLGADLAALVGPGHDFVDRTVLCVPLINGGRYLREVRLRGKIRGALTEADGGDGAADADRGIDYGGHYISPQLIQELEAHDLMAADSTLARTISCVDIRGRDSMTVPLSALATRLEERGARVDTRVLIDEPFWNALGPVVPEAFIDGMVHVLTREEGAS